MHAVPIASPVDHLLDLYPCADTARIPLHYPVSLKASFHNRIFRMHIVRSVIGQLANQVSASPTESRRVLTTDERKATTTCLFRTLLYTLSN
jgi:hypothetical protein